MAGQPKEYLAELREKLNGIQQIDREMALKRDQGKIGEEEKGQELIMKDQLFEEFKQTYTVYNDSWNLLSRYLSEINEATDIYYQSVYESTELIKNLYNDLEEKRESLDSEAYETLKNEVQELEDRKSVV